MLFYVENVAENMKHPRLSFLKAAAFVARPRAVSLFSLRLSLFSPFFSLLSLSLSLLCSLSPLANTTCTIVMMATRKHCTSNSHDEGPGRVSECAEPLQKHNQHCQQTTPNIMRHAKTRANNNATTAPATTPNTHELVGVHHHNTTIV